MAVKKKPKYRKIINAAVDVIAENGFYHAQVSKIAKRAGVADGTIYIYFKNKEDLLISLFEDKMGQFIESTRGELEGIADVNKKLLTLVRMHFKWLNDDRHLAIVTQLELRQSNKNVRLKINDILKGYLAIIDDIIEIGQETHIFKTDIDSRLARQMIFGTLDETVSNWVMNDQKYDLMAQAEPIADLLINGLKK